MTYRRVGEAEDSIAISPVEGRVLVSIGERHNGVTYQAGNWWATREDAQAILDAHDQLDARKRTPPEPEPGAYLIGGVLCIRFGTRTGAQWFADTNETGMLRLRLDWPIFVEAMGIDADTPIIHLVPTAEVRDDT